MSLLAAPVATADRSMTRGTTSGRLASTLPWMSALLGILLSNALLGLASAPTAVLLALLGVVHSALGFHRHGDSRVTAAGVFLFGMLLFGYFPTLYYAWLEQDFTPVRHEIRGLAALLSFQFILYAVWSTTDRPSPLTERRAVPPSAWAPGVSLGIASLVVGVTIAGLDIAALRPLAQPAGYGGVILIAVSLVQAGRRLNVFVLLVIGFLFATFVALLFTGGGRLVLGSLALALTIAVGFAWRPSFVKPVILGSLPPGLAFLARIRADSVANPLSGYQESGLESVVWPQRLFFRVLGDTANGRLALGNGETFGATAVIWVPRDVWAAKPVGFGTTLTQLYKPELLAVGHSEAALVQGEFVYNFGLWGLLIAPIVMGVGVYRLDAWLARLHGTAALSTSTLITQAMCVVLTAGIVDLVWVGTFTYASRAGFTCVLLVFLWMLAHLLGLTDRHATRDPGDPSIEAQYSRVGPPAGGLTGPQRGAPHEESVGIVADSQQ